MKMEVALNNKRSVEDVFGDLKENLHRGEYLSCHRSCNYLDLLSVLFLTFSELVANPENYFITR